jgi:hypothetical protein
MKRRLLTSITLAAFMSGLIGGPLLAQQTTQTATMSGTGLTIPFTATGTNNGGTADVTGTFSLIRFATQNGQLFAVGTLTATVPDTVGVRTVVQRVALPVTAINHGAPTATGVIQQASCGILHLELGPLDLDLLGLVVHLDRVVLDISAESGPGNLLGNLLCSIAGLLDSGPLNQILAQLVGLLNQLLGAL